MSKLHFYCHVQSKFYISFLSPVTELSLLKSSDLFHPLYKCNFYKLFTVKKQVDQNKSEKLNYDNFQSIQSISVKNAYHYQYQGITSLSKI